MTSHRPNVPSPDKDKFVGAAKSWPRQNWIALIILIAVLGISMIAVALFKRPGQMGVIESQSMDMSKMRPPTGAVPVLLSRVERRQIGNVVTYSGTVRAFIDEDVNARVTGTIASMPVYPGDRVRRGQLLVQLDPSSSEYRTRAEETRLLAVAEQHNVRIAGEEMQQKEEDAGAVKNQYEQAQQEIKDAQADFDYWNREIKRQETLLKAQVVSQEEYDRELAQFKSAEAKLKQSQRKAAEMLNRAQAAREAIEAALHHVKHQEVMAKQAAVAAKTATILESYTRIRASGNAVVTQRVVSPGVVVSPGTLLLRLAQIDQIRVQSSVPTTTLSDVRIGDPVTIRTKVRGSEEINARITAVFPSADPTTRTTIVESLIPNPDHRLLPGQYAVMEITTESQLALTVPTSAVVRRNGVATVWVATGTPAVAQPRTVQTGASNADDTEVRSGLTANEQVIAMGQAELQPGTPVTGTEWGAQGPTRLPEVKETGILRLDSNNNWQTSYKGSSSTINLTMRNVPAKGGDNAIVATVLDPQGKPRSGSRVVAKTSMPAMDMDGPELSATTSGDGKTDLSTFFMSGPWHVEMTVTSGQTKESLAFDIEVL